MGAINAAGPKRGKTGYRSLRKKFPTSGTPVCSVAATGTFTMATKPTANDTVTIGDVTYTFVATPDAAGEVAIGAAVANSKANLLAAINDGDTYNDAHPDVTAADWDGDDLVVTAKDAGTAGNSIATTCDLDDGSDDWGAATLAGGVDGTAGEISDMMVDDTYLYICIAAVTTAGNWRRIALGNAY